MRRERFARKGEQRCFAGESSSRRTLKRASDELNRPAGVRNHRRVPLSAAATSAATRASSGVAFKRALAASTPAAASLASSLVAPRASR